MRNSEAQRYARWSLSAAALLAAVVAGVYARNMWLARLAASKAPPAVPPSVEQQSNEFSFSKVEGQRTVYTVRASRTTQFKEGSRNLLEDVAIVVYGKKGERNDTLRTKACDFISNTGKISCAGQIQMSLQAAAAPHASANAVQVETSAVTFSRESGIAQTDKPVTFHWPGGDGRAVGLSYDSAAGALRLMHSVELTLSPSPAVSSAPGAPEEKPDRIADQKSVQNLVRVSGESMSFQRDARVVTVEGNVHAQQLAYELHADKFLLELDTTFQARRFVASGNPQLRDLDPQGAAALSADEIVSLLRPDGSVASIVGTGNVHGTRDLPAGGDGIDAGRMELNLATVENLPRLLTASNGVTLTSTSAAYNGGTRHVQSDALEVHFSTATPSGETLIESVNSLGPARADWQSMALVNGKHVPQTTRMAGQQMNLKYGGQNQLQELAGTGGVQVTRKLGDAPEETTSSHELTAKFGSDGEWTAIDQNGDVHLQDAARSVRGDHAHLDRATNTTLFSGSVVFTDASTRTTAQSASYSAATNTVHAEGHVLTTELRPAAEGVLNLAPEPAHISADRLVADTAKGHAVYSGKSRLWQGQSVIEGDTIEMDSPSHVLVVKGNVRSVFLQAPWNPGPGEGPGQGQSSSKTMRSVASKSPGANGRGAPQLGHARGGQLTYWENESRGRIEQNARVDSEQASIQANQIDLYFSEGGAGTGTKQLSRSVATGDVTVRQEDRRGTSDRAEYTSSEGKFVLSEGKPTLYSSTGDTTTGRQLTFYFADDRILVDSADGSKTVTLHQVEK